MQSEWWDRVSETFASCLELTPEARRTFLEETCRTDPRLRAEVERLLREHEKAGDFIEFCLTPTLAAEATLQPVRRFGMATS